MDKVKTDGEAREWLAQILKAACFPNEVPKIGQRVQIACLNNDKTASLLEGIVLNRGYDVEEGVKPPENFVLEVSIFDIGIQTGDQDYLALDYNSGTGEWSAFSGENGEWYPAVLKIIG